MDLGIKSLEGIRNSSIDFVTKKLKLEIFESADAAAAIKEVKQIVRNIKPDVKLKEITNRKAWEADSEEKNESGIKRLKPFQFGIGAAFFAAAVLLKLSAGVELAMYLTAYLLVGGEVLIKSIRNIFRGQVFDENFLMSLATIGAFAIGEYSEGVAVMIFYQIGEMFQDLAVDRSRRSIKELMDIRPDYANLVSEGRVIQVPPEDVPVGAYIIVKPGERVPLDGRITEGRSMLDTSALTGESVPREANAGDEILAGFINNSGVLTVEVSKEFGESTVSKILDMVENASSKKSPTENFITKFARYYTPAVVFSALA
ncbi:MAG TPA: heavy metal translocating P-type ATPase, partial [Bacillota bacterium]|nr:heavy metal translocating P-type ATPase [Bacillota bacterium]